MLDLLTRRQLHILLALVELQVEKQAPMINELVGIQNAIATYLNDTPTECNMCLDGVSHQFCE